MLAGHLLWTLGKIRARKQQVKNQHLAGQGDNDASRVSSAEYAESARAGSDDLEEAFSTYFLTPERGELHLDSALLQCWLVTCFGPWARSAPGSSR